MWKYAIAIVIAGHGLAHLAGVLATWAGMDIGFTQRPWLFSSNVVLTSPIGRFFGFIWLAGMIVMLAAAVTLVFTRREFYPLAIVAAVFSLAAILPWWNTVVPGARVGAIFDLLLLLAVLSPWKQNVFQVTP